MDSALLEPEWDRVGLTVLSTDADRTLLLFSSTGELQQFRTKIEAFGGDIPEDQKGPSYASFIGGIERIGAIEPSDRIGKKLKSEGICSVSDFDPAELYVLDLELWDLGSRDLRRNKLREISDFVEELGGEVLDEYFGPSITMIRARCTADAIENLLNVEEVSSLDRPPQPDVGVRDATALTIADIPSLEPVSDDAPLIGIIDSGMNEHPLIADILVGAIAVPEHLGTTDEWGHGTRVAGLAVFGDLRGQLAAGTLHRFGRLCSARVVNERGAFDDAYLTPKLIREAVTRLHRDFGCRLFVSALADIKHVYDGGKVGPWAATLDELVRELDVVIIVAAGNRAPRSNEQLEEAVTGYPHYLLEPDNRLLEPAGALNVITVGSIAHSHGLDENLTDNLWARPITEAGQPSPFTRVGPGIGGSVKPDLVDTGGTMVMQAGAAVLHEGGNLPSAGILTLNHRYLDRLFTSRSGTSYAAPLAAAKAAQILTRFPGASANLVRALLIGSARPPEAAATVLDQLGPEAIKHACGHGRIDLERAAFSDDGRVVLYAEDSLLVDQFGIFEVPIPDIFQKSGRRTIQVTLAYDPPVRHTRKDYVGNTMSFRLHRGSNPDLLFDHYRKRSIKAEGKHPDLEGRYKCILPGSVERELNTVQIARKSFVKGLDGHGDPWHLVVSCEGGWAAEIEPRQRFALVVELSHEEPIRLYDRLRTRLRA